MRSSDTPASDKEVWDEALVAHDEPELEQGDQAPAEWGDEPGSDERLSEETRKKLAENGDE